MAAHVTGVEPAELLHGSVDHSVDHDSRFGDVKADGEAVDSEPDDLLAGATSMSDTATLAPWLASSCAVAAQMPLPTAGDEAQPCP